MINVLASKCTTYRITATEIQIIKRQADVESMRILVTDKRKALLCFTEFLHLELDISFLKSKS